MKTRFLGLAIVMVALAVLVNVLALSTAEVNSTMAVNVVNTSTALIALAAPVAPATLDSDVTVDTATNNVLEIALDHGLQPGSTYVFKSVFSIKNNSDDSIQVSVAAPLPPAGMTISFKNTATDAVITNLTMAPDAQVNVYMEIVNTSGAAINNNTITVQLTATKV